MGLWVASPSLGEGEVIRWRKAANRKQGSTRAVGGRLFLTDRRLLFQPSRFDQAVGGECWSAHLEEIESIDIEGRDRRQVAQRDYGALRRRLCVVTGSSTELFVVNSVEEAVKALNEGVFVVRGAVAGQSGAIWGSHQGRDTVGAVGASASLGGVDKVRFWQPFVAAGVFVALLVAVGLEVAGHGDVAAAGRLVGVVALAVGGINTAMRFVLRRRKPE